MPIWKRDQDMTPVAQSEPPARQAYNPGIQRDYEQPEPPEARAIEHPEVGAGAEADTGMGLPAGEPVAVIDSNSSIDGTFRSRGNVLVEGSFHGTLEADKTVLVARGAQTQAQLRASDTIVCGSFDGEIVCERQLKIASTATISGEIKTPVLVIEEGATVNCRFTMARAGGF